MQEFAYSYIRILHNFCAYARTKKPSNSLFNGEFEGVLPGETETGGEILTNYLGRLHQPYFYIESFHALIGAVVLSIRVNNIISVLQLLC